MMPMAAMALTEMVAEGMRARLYQTTPLLLLRADVPTHADAGIRVHAWAPAAPIAESLRRFVGAACNLQCAARVEAALLQIPWIVTAERARASCSSA
jgi:hypothetical protein